MAPSTRSLKNEPNLPSRRKGSDSDDSLGEPVFYPEGTPQPSQSTQVPLSLPAPSRRTSKGKGRARSSSSASQAPSRPPSTTFPTSLYTGTIDPKLLPQDPPKKMKRNPESFPFPHVPATPDGPATTPGGTHFSPPSHLADLIENWNISTPSPESQGDRPPPSTLSSVLSEPEPSLFSPNELPLSALIDDALIQEGSPVPTNAQLPRDFLGSRLFSPKPSSHLSTVGTPLISGLRSPHLPALSPIPARQLSWSQHEALRRSSSPSITISSAPSARASPLPGRTLLPFSSLALSTSSLGLTTGIYDSPTGSQPDVFSADYQMTPPSTDSPAMRQLEEYGEPSSGAVDINFNEFFSFPATPQHLPEPTGRSIASSELSRIAAIHLQDRILDEEFVRRYEIRDELGAGGFGFVCSAVQTGYGNVPGVEVAVKFIFKDRIQDWEHTVIRGEPIESYVLRRCDHPNIISSIEYYSDDEFFYLVQELHGDPWSPGHTLEPENSLPASQSVPGMPLHRSPLQIPPALATFGVLSSPLSERNLSPINSARPPMARRASHDLFEAVEHRRFTEDQARIIFKQIVEAVAYLHSKGIYHRDLKDENIVIDRNLHVKIIDFGSAVIENRLLPPLLYDCFRGTMSYASAEVISGRPYYAGPVDIWSLGVILAIILTGESCFPNTSYAQSGTVKMKHQISAEAYDLMHMCVRTDPYRRASAETLARHRWFSAGMHRGSV